MQEIQESKMTKLEDLIKRAAINNQTNIGERSKKDDKTQEDESSKGNKRKYRHWKKDEHSSTWMENAQKQLSRRC